jgi:toxin-antitoxin system PIN domain toxin
MKSYFPDINVWLALAYRGHRNHPIAAAWFQKLKMEQAIFCRTTQLGFLRLLTNPAVMGEETKGQRDAWAIYDQLRDDERVTFYSEVDPERIETGWRALTASSRFALQQWPDAYLAAFARTAGLTLLTLDKGLARLAGDDCLLLRSE